jgi:MoxR-like ATPase
MNLSTHSPAPVGAGAPANGNNDSGLDLASGRAGWRGDVQQIQKDVQQAAAWVPVLQTEMARVIVGQRYLVDRLIVGLLCNGHLLLEGVPGLAKTLSLKTLAQTLSGAKFQRLQFTPDMLPADVVGTMIYNLHDNVFQTKHGPIFANLVLVDEINRAPAKVQSALLEAMQERQVTLGENTYRLPDPFLVMATQNPIEHEGTYPLPEAQVDRFLLKLVIGYPSKPEERAILDAMATSDPELSVDAVVSIDQLAQARRLVNRIYVDDKIRDYVVDIVTATRAPSSYDLPLADYLMYGASPRATIALTLAARAWAFIHGRGYVIPSDVKTLAPDVLRHRLGLSYEAEAENIQADDLVARILAALPNP